MKLSKVNFRGIEGYLIDDKILQPDRRSDLYYYEIRHSDEDFSEPCTVEDFVFVNRWGTIVFKQPINHLLDTWAETRLSTNLTEDETSDFWTALSSGESIEHKDI